MSTPEFPLMKKAMRWFFRASGAIQSAGGDPSGVIGMFPEEVLNHLVRNDLHLVYIPEEKP